MKRTLQICALAVLEMILAMRTNAQTITISNLWSISTSEARPYLTNSTSNSYWERGVAYNALNNHAYIVSRFAPLKVAVLDGDTGAEVGFLNLTGVFPGGTPNGTFALSTIAVADDGAIYAANLTVSVANGPFRVYRWTNEVDPPVLVYSANPSADRYGETFDVRGSGTNTEIIASATAAATITLLKPSDDALTTFTNRTMPITGLAAVNQLRGIAFGLTNTFYIKNYNSPSNYFCSYDLAAGSASTLTAHEVAQRIGPFDVDPVHGILAGVETANAGSPHNLLVYDLSSSPPAQIFNTAFPPPAANNGNVVGQVQISGDRIFAIDTQNGVVMAKINIDTNPVPPTVAQQPASQTVVLGGYTTLSAAATGTKPLSYQWFFDGANAIPDATNASVRFTNVTFAEAGAYSVRVTNIAGETNSNEAHVTISPTTLSLVLTQCWALPAGTTNYPYLTTEDNQRNHRGLAYNAAYNHLLAISRSPTTNILVFEATTGAYLHSLDLTGISGGTFPINMIACAEDGKVVVANLTVNGSTDPFKVYVFDDSLGGNTALLGWSGNPGDAGFGDTNRWGDNLDVRGTGLGLEVLVGSRNSRRLAIINGLFLALPPIVIDVPDAEAGNFGLSICWGAGDTCWGKSSGTALRHVALDVNTHFGTVLRTITNYPTMSVIAVDSANQLLAGISLETPDTLRLLNISPTLSTPLELDTEFFLSDNPNANGTGQIDFGNGKLFALDSNNGIIALSVWPRLRYSLSGSILTFTWDGTHSLQATPDLGVPFTNAVGAVSGHTVDTATTGNLFYRLKD